MSEITKNVALTVEEDPANVEEPKEGENLINQSEAGDDDDDAEEEDNVTAEGIILLPNGGKDISAASMRRVEEIFDPSKKHGTPRAAVAGYIRHAKGALTEQGNISMSSFTLMFAMHRAPEETMNAALEVQEENAQKEEMSSKMGPIVLEAEADKKEVMEALEDCACMEKYEDMADDMAKEFYKAVVDARMAPHIAKHQRERQARTAIRKTKVKKILAHWKKSKGSSTEGGSVENSY